MATLPEAPALVLLVDTSRSMSEEQLQRSVELARRWIAGHSHPMVALLSFDRKVHALTPGLVTAEEALQVLAHFPINRSNGSDQGEAIRAGARLLRDAEGGGRLLLLTDGHLRQDLTASTFSDILEHDLSLLYAHITEPTGLTGKRRERERTLRDLAFLHGTFTSCSKTACDEAPLIVPSTLNRLSLSPPLAVDAKERATELGTVAAGKLVTPFGLTRPTQATAGQLNYQLWGQTTRRTVPQNAELSRLDAANEMWADPCPLHPLWVETSRAVTPTRSHAFTLPGRIAAVTTPLPLQEAQLSCSPHPPPNDNRIFVGTPPPHGYVSRIDATLGEHWWGETFRAGMTACGAAKASVTLWLDGAEVEHVQLDSRYQGLTEPIRNCLLELGWSLTVPTEAEAMVGLPDAVTIRRESRR